MNVVDPVADYLTRVRNGLNAAAPEVEIPRGKNKGGPKSNLFE